MKGSQVLFPELGSVEIDARKRNILRSPKKGGCCSVDSIPYLEELGIEIIENGQPIQFTSNINSHIHRWAPYVQGFSASFVQGIFDRYKDDYENPVVLDPFAGCGTVLVQAKLNGFKSVGTELNPLLQFIANTKLNCWDVSPSYLLKTYNSLRKDHILSAPEFLKSTSQFNELVLRNLERLAGSIEAVQVKSTQKQKVKDLLRLAFSAILVDCSNLKRSPCLGYVKNKYVDDSAPSALFGQKVREISDDLLLMQSEYGEIIETPSEVRLANAMDYTHRDKFDLMITSPPYMNGLDYVMNYKIEMGWLGFADTQKELKKVKDEMVVCDNVSKGLIRKFSKSSSYTNDWLEAIKERIRKRIIKRGAYRREDMPYIVHKYFDDLYKVMKNILPSLKRGGRFIMVIGDSLIADVYIPTDLLLARIGKDLGLEIESIEKARERRSGQIRSYKLRESIIILRKR
ncbi:MAG: hypothetical protein JW804_04115 [Sedimentisphaerales bacterium]|nr:hypothetical protein [Sedimentisphaerales bacterium]